MVLAHATEAMGLGDRVNMLLLNTHDKTGGAAKAAYRLLSALRRSNVGAKLLVRNKLTDDGDVIAAESGWLGWCVAYLDFLPLKLYPRRLTNSFSRAGAGINLSRWVERLKPEIVHLHWPHEGFLRVETLASLPVPVVWTMHDSWVFTGGCHLPAGCRKYETTCGACPVLGSRVEKDLSQRVWIRKQKNYPLANMTFISPSNWLAEKARSSSLLRNSHIEVIPNAVDVSVYSPGDKLAARFFCNLPVNRKIILAGAKHILSDYNKGADLLWEVLGKLSDELRSKCLVVFFGEQQDDFKPPIEIDFVNYGAVNDEESIINLYRAADIFLMTSRQENLPNTISEAMSCALPCAAFAVGGIPEQVIHRENGCLVEPYDTDAMSLEVAWLLSAKDEQQALGRRAREFAQERYSLQKVALQHIALYEKVLRSAHDVGMFLT